ncbi:hypothetical protein ACFLWU_02895, partial [Chloroflexota bacterium]
YEQGGYYFESFVYRMTKVFSLIKAIEDEMVYMDTTIALKDDMEFIKFLRLFPQLMSNLQLFDGFDYDPFYQKDHIFKDNLDNMAQSLVKDDDICGFLEFGNNFSQYMSELEYMCRFIDGMSPDEDRLRWDRLQVFHLAVMVFLNSFGYDFQYTNEEKVNDLLNRIRKNRIADNFIKLVDMHVLADQKEFKKIIKLISNRQ